MWYRTACYSAVQVGNVNLVRLARCVEIAPCIASVATHIRNFPAIPENFCSMAEQMLSNL